MTVTTFPTLERLLPLIDLQIHQIALKRFDFHCAASFPYNLLISVLDTKAKANDFLLNHENGEKIRLVAGHAYIIPCNLLVYYERTPLVTVVTMRFNLSFLHGLDVFDGHHDIEELDKPDLAQLLRDLFVHQPRESRGETTPIKSALVLKAAVTDACIACWPRTTVEMAPRMWRYEKLFHYVREHTDAKLSVDQLASLYGMRQDAFSRAFRRDIGITPKKYIVDVLLKRITTLLLTSHLSVKEISHRLGFSSEYYLSRFFKKHTKLSPTEFRKQPFV